jgi:hypothetical protein
LQLTLGYMFWFSIPRRSNKGIRARVRMFPRKAGVGLWHILCNP